MVTESPFGAAALEGAATAIAAGRNAIEKAAIPPAIIFLFMMSIPFENVCLFDDFEIRHRCLQGLSCAHMWFLSSKRSFCSFSSSRPDAQQLPTPASLTTSSAGQTKSEELRHPRH